MVLSMRLNGYASIGHLFEHHKEQFNEGYKSVLFQLVTKIYMGLDETIVERDGFRQFANFFENVPVSIESASKYIRGILKRHEVSDFSFQIVVEKLVWKMIHSVYIRKQYISTDKEELAFRVFCLFNRICETDSIPMKLSAQGMHLIYSWLSIDALMPNSSATFGNVLSNITKRKDPYLIVITKKCYDQYVRDILIEERLMFRIKRFIVKSGKSRAKIGKLSC